MVRSVRFAICQFAPIPAGHEAQDDGHANLQRALSFVKEAKDGQADVVVFPEYFLTGIIADPKHHHLAHPPHNEQAARDHPVIAHWVEAFRRAAKEHAIDIVAGTIVERTHDSSGRPVLHNVAHYINSGGEIIGRYTKVNLWADEKNYLTKGERPYQVFETSYGRVGMLICWDLAWPEAFRALLLEKVDVVIMPTCWGNADGSDTGLAHNPDCEALFIDSTVVSRTFENEIAVVFANMGGPSADGWIGHSCVAVPFKGIIAMTKSNEEELLFANVDLDILKDAREVYNCRNDLVKKRRAEGTLPEGVKD